MDDQFGVVRLPELDVPETGAVAHIAEDDLVVKRGRFRPPRAGRDSRRRHHSIGGRERSSGRALLGRAGREQQPGGEGGDEDGGHGSHGAPGGWGEWWMARLVDRAAGTGWLG